MALMWVQIASRTKKLKKSGSNLSQRFKIFVIAYSAGMACVNAVLVVLRIYTLSAMLVLLTMIMIAVRPEHVPEHVRDTSMEPWSREPLGWGIR